MGKYICQICGKKSTQKSHHEAHIKSNDHDKTCEIFKLKLGAKTHEELIKEYPQFKIINNQISDDDFLLDGETEQDNINAIKHAKNKMKLDMIERIIQSKIIGKMENISNDQHFITNKYIYIIVSFLA